MLMFGRPLRTRLDLMKPNLNRKMVNKQNEQSIQAAVAKGNQTRRLEVGDPVMARDYQGNLKWRSGLVIEQTGPLLYKVQVAPDMIWRRHIDQLRPTCVTGTAVQPKVSSPCSEPLQVLPSEVITPMTPLVPSPVVISVPAIPAPATQTRARASPKAQPPSEVTTLTVPERCYPERVRKAPDKLNI
ncbi:hypothetical protein QZH41_000191 [Actinostola sp. cb2023]|nr:hypothetical protein QZH41_000191 [Actinostola sp. cb2023]